MNHRSTNPNNHESQLHTSDVVRWVLVGIFMGALLMFLFLHVTNTPAANYGGASGSIIPAEYVRMLNDDTLRVLSDTFTPLKN